MNCCTVGYRQNLGRLTEILPTIPYELISFNQQKRLRNCLTVVKSFLIGLKSLALVTLFSMRRCDSTIVKNTCNT